MIRPIRLRPEATEAVLIKLIGEQLHDIYSNKSSEEYKMCGDITKSPTYEKIEIGVSELKTLKGFSKNDAKDMETMFMTLHRPIFKKMVAEYIAKPEDRNVVFTSVFTVGYRLLVSELSRIIASTEATNKGIVYKPDKASRHRRFPMHASDFLQSKLHVRSLVLLEELHSPLGFWKSFPILQHNQIHQI